MWGRRRKRKAPRDTLASPVSTKALRWRQCAVCSYDIRTGEGDRSCHWYACPSLPEELDVFCPRCNYDFFTREGSPECGEHPRCDYAREVAPLRVRTVRAWFAAHGTDAAEGSS